MVRFEHTPGPWALGYETNLPESAQIITADGWHLATVRHDPVEGNALLMIAAPLLLEALELAEATISRLVFDANDAKRDSVKGTRDVIRAAINAAIMGADR